VRVKIEKAWQDVLVVRKINEARRAGVTSREIGVDFENCAVADDDAGVAAYVISNGVEQPAAANNDVAGLKRNLGLTYKNGRDRDDGKSTE